MTMKFLRWFVINGLFAGFIYMGFVEKHEGAYNAAMFMAWITIVCSFFISTDHMVEMLKETGRSAPPWVDWIFDIGVTLTFVWFGAWVTGVFYLFHILLCENAWAKSRIAEKQPTR